MESGIGGCRVDEQLLVLGRVDGDDVDVVEDEEASGGLDVACSVLGREKYRVHP